MYAVVNVPLCPLHLRPCEGSERTDEVFLGMALDLLEEAGGDWYRARTSYGYEGYVCGDALLWDRAGVGLWMDLPKAVVVPPFCDLLERPDLRSPVLFSLPRGCLLAPAEEVHEDWPRVCLPDGQTGYVRQDALAQYPPAPESEADLRTSLTGAALSYLGTPYRWGGKSPLGIDCSGLTSMAYLLNGISIWRDSTIREGYPVHPIDREHLGPGDLLYFPGHTAMYLGDGDYVHATARAGGGRVVVNSLDPSSPRYRADLAEGITAMGSIF